MTQKISSTQIGIIVTTLITAGIHFTLLFPDLMFILNALGYLGMLGLYFLPAAAKYHKQIRLAFILYTILTLFAWVLIGERSIIGYLTKLDEIILATLLFMDKSD